MPNVKGGKNYKKSKHVSCYKAVMIDRQPGQMYGRIIRNVGGDRMIVFCNDGKTRICHIRGAMRKKVWMKIGDIVLISLRELTEAVGVSKKSTCEIGDILAKYDDDLIPMLKKLEDFNPILLRSLETQDGKFLADLEDMDETKLSKVMDDDDGAGIEFERDGEREKEGEKEGQEKEKEKEENEEDDDSESSDGEGGKKLRGKEKATVIKAKGRAIKEKERAGDGATEDLNIDDI